MKSVLLSFLILFSCSFVQAAISDAPKVSLVAPPVKARNSQQDAALKKWIEQIKILAEQAQTDADNAEKEAEEGRQELQVANDNADVLQKSIDAQAVQLNQALADEKKAKDHDAKVTKENNKLKDVLGLEAALIALFVCLWLRVPSFGIWGIAATVAAPIVVFTAVKLIL